MRNNRRLITNVHNPMSSHFWSSWTPWPEINLPFHSRNTRKLLFAHTHLTNTLNNSDRNTSSKAQHWHYGHVKMHARCTRFACLTRIRRVMHERIVYELRNRRQVFGCVLSEKRSWKWHDVKKKKEKKKTAFTRYVGASAAPRSTCHNCRLSEITIRTSRL